MPSTPTGSRASADLAPGTVVAGFRVERLIGRGARAAVYEATQLSLDRRVALKVLDDPAMGEVVQRLAWPEHPGAVGLYGAGAGEHGPWLAMRLVRGGTLETRRAPLDAVAAALAQAHAQGIVHGDVNARNVLVEDGRAYLSDFGLAPGSADEDRAALAALVRHQDGRRARRRRVALVAAGACVVAAAALAAILVAGDDATPAGAPAVPAGTRPVGSHLAAGALDTVDCSGRPPSGASLACTISQRDLAGRPMVVPADGTITSWAVRGARGTLALQVLRVRGAGLVEADRSTETDIAGPGLHIVPSRMPVAAGDRVALVVSPGSAVGLRRGGAPASTERWFGPLLEPARRPEGPAGSGLDRELLLRVDVRPGAGPSDVAPLRGERAAAAPAGRRLAIRDVAVGDGELRSVAVVALGGAVALDLFDGSRRLARAPVRGADSRGELVAVTTAPGEAHVRWRNPRGEVVDRALEVAPDGVRPVR